MNYFTRIEQAYSKICWKKFSFKFSNFYCASAYWRAILI